MVQLWFGTLYSVIAPELSPLSFINVAVAASVIAPELSHLSSLAFINFVSVSFSSLCVFYFLIYSSF